MRVTMAVRVTMVVRVVVRVVKWVRVTMVVRVVMRVVMVGKSENAMVMMTDEGGSWEKVNIGERVRVP